MGKTPYPWKLTKRQKETFEQICIGNDKYVNLFIGNSLTAKKLVNRQKIGINKEGFTIYSYTVPLHIHMEWCDWCSENFDDEGNEL